MASLEPSFFFVAADARARLPHPADVDRGPPSGPCCLAGCVVDAVQFSGREAGSVDTANAFPSTPLVGPEEVGLNWGGASINPERL